MSRSRDVLMAALQRVLVPELRARGFKRSLPHLRRTVGERVDLVTVQLSSAGGRFVVELGAFPATGYRDGRGRPLPPDEVTMAHLRLRHRLGAPPSGDHWFAFTDATAEVVAADVVARLDEAEAWWAEAPRHPRYPFAL